MSRLKKVAVAVGTLTVAGVAARLLSPRNNASISPASEVTGDRDLAARALAFLPRNGIYSLGIAEVTPHGSNLATIGVPLAATFEIGSITKGLTGILYLDSVQRGEVHPATTLGELLDLDDSAAATITLAELAQHRSGLPRQLLALRDVASIVIRTFLAKNPFNGTAEDLLKDLRRAPVGVNEPQYSNLGFAALGHALSAAAGTDYPTLLRTRLADPLSLGTCYIPVGGEAGLDDSAVQGYDEHGRAQQPWTAPEYAPAGGVRTNVGSMAKLARALLDGSAPGAAALDPVADFSAGGQDRVGATTLRLEHAGESLLLAP